MDCIVISEKLGGQRVRLYESEGVMRLIVEINARNLESGYIIADRASTGSAEEIEELEFQGSGGEA